MGNSASQDHDTIPNQTLCMSAEQQICDTFKISETASLVSIEPLMDAIEFAHVGIETGQDGEPSHDAVEASPAAIVPMLAVVKPASVSINTLLDDTEPQPIDIKPSSTDIEASSEEIEPSSLHTEPSSTTPSDLDSPSTPTPAIHFASEIVSISPANDRTGPPMTEAIGHGFAGCNDTIKEESCDNATGPQPSTLFTAGDFRRFSGRSRKSVHYAATGAQDEDISASLSNTPPQWPRGSSSARKMKTVGKKGRTDRRDSIASPSRAKVLKSSKKGQRISRQRIVLSGPTTDFKDTIRVAQDAVAMQSPERSNISDTIRVSVSGHALSGSPGSALIPLAPEQQPQFTDEAYVALQTASRQIMSKTSIENKPLPRASPEVWADTRQALCETILYYQAWQGACYISKGVLYSFMFDSNGHTRDLIDGDVVIARAGGAMARDKATNDMYQTKDQEENFQVAAIRAAIAQQNPIVIFCGDENADVPTKMPHRYNSLGWFKVTHWWSEKTTSKRGSLVQIKYRFEKLGGYDSWWLNASSSYHGLGDFEAPITLQCFSCGVISSQVYLQSWMCLNPECQRFWTLPAGQAPVDEDLDYDPRFLKQSTQWLVEEPPHALRPQLPDPATRLGDDKAYAMTRGLCCPQCGKCTPRYKWDRWVCSGCQFEHVPPSIMISAKLLNDPWHITSRTVSQSHDLAMPSVVQVSTTHSHRYRIVRYSISGIDGYICHMIANQTIVQEQRGPDDMFEALQTLDCGLERRQFHSGRREYMNSFSNNRGMPYKFIASSESTSFENSPWPLNEARARLSWAARLVNGSDPGFNELLTIGYFDKQQMKYHDDGEHGLGPTVASLSLGYPADMFFRIKAKHWTGVSKSGTMTDVKPIPHTPFHNAMKDVGSWPPLLDADLPRVEQLREAAKRFGLQDNVRDRKPWLRLRLGHGDMVIMRGEQVQEYLEHQVESLGTLRFALTCRTILPGHLGPGEMPDYQVLPDDGRYDGSGLL